MSATVAVERPPFVTFEMLSVEDRDASLKAGHYVAKDVNYAVITPIGSKDRTFKEVDVWFEQLEKAVKCSRFPAEWLRGYQAEYKAWKEGREIPVDGTPIKVWPPISKAQAENCLILKIRTVEDLAAANEETISRLGMGGRALKQRAIEWLESSSQVGKQSEMIAALKAETRDLKAAVERLEKAKARLQEELRAEKKKNK